LLFVVSSAGFTRSTSAKEEAAEEISFEGIDLVRSCQILPDLVRSCQILSDFVISC